MSHFKELGELVAVIITAIADATNKTARVLGPKQTALLMAFSLLATLAFACFAASQFESFVLHVLTEVLRFLAVILLWRFYECFWGRREACVLYRSARYVGGKYGFSKRVF